MYSAAAAKEKYVATKHRSAHAINVQLLIAYQSVFTILAQIVRRHWALAEWRHRKSTCCDYDCDKEIKI